MFKGLTTRELLGAILGFSTAILALLLVYSTISTRQLVGEVRAGQKDRVSTFALLQDCVTPQGKCAKSNAKNVARIQSQLVLAEVAAVACADAPGQQTPKEIRACVQRTMKQVRP